VKVVKEEEKCGGGHSTVFVQIIGRFEKFFKNLKKVSKNMFTSNLKLFL
jgi:hypothetical protein